MPYVGTNYVGNPAVGGGPSAVPGPSVSPTVVLPTDPDDFSAGAFYQPYQVLANFVSWLTNNSVIKNIQNLVSGYLTFTGASQLIPFISSNVDPSSRKLLFEFSGALILGARVYIRFYAVINGVFEITSNARWDGINWQKDALTTPSSKILSAPTNSGTMQIFVRTGATNFSDSSWENRTIMTPISTATIVNGGLNIGGLVTATHLGGFQSSPPTITPLGGVGGGATFAAAPSNVDVHGRIQVTVGAGPGVGTLFQVNFFNSFQVAPTVLIFPANQLTAALTQPIWVDAFTTHFIPSIATTTLSAGATYAWFYHVLGV